MTDQGYPPRQTHNPVRPGPPRPPHEAGGTGWQVIDAFDDGADTDTDLPPWAVPGGIEPLRPTRRPLRVQDLDRLGARDPLAPPEEAPRRDADLPSRLRRRPGRGRAAAARRRKSKRRLITWGAAAIIVVILTGTALYLTRSQAPKSRFVTTLQKGEFRAVPDACGVLGAGALRQLMNATPRSIQPQQGQAQSQCTYTVDAKPTFRVLNIDLQAMGASLVPVGNGSATAAATYTFAQQRRLMAKPPKHSPQPPATISSLPGLGTEAFSAVQAFRTKTATDLVTVLARYRNVLITVSFQGQVSGGFGPVTVSQLRSGAMTVARAALAAVKAEPTV